MSPQDCSRNHRLSKKMSALMPPKNHIIQRFQDSKIT